MTMSIPTLLLKQLYTFGSLENTKDGVQLSVKNRLTDTEIIAFVNVNIDGHHVPRENITLHLDDGTQVKPDDITDKNSLMFPLKKVVTIVISPMEALPEGKHDLEITFEARHVGELSIQVQDSITADTTHLTRIPRDDRDDYSDEIIKKRQQFLKDFSGTDPEHIFNFSFDPDNARGNCEHLTGVAQIPIGLAGPIVIDGEHAKGEFMIPLATTEGTLVASYNRGIKVLNLCGGVKCTVVGDAMQRAPVFVFHDARGSREFVTWVEENFDKIKEEAEATTRVGKLLNIDPYQSNKFAYLRFNYSTGDAAGQNMVGRATFAACSWIIDNYPPDQIAHFYLESNFATDKKASQVNIMRTRGKRVTAEITLKRDVLIQHMRVQPENLFYHAGVANVGAFLSGANNNGLHSANAITAMFIATGQDVANVAESSAGVIYSELTPEKDLYLSITIPSLIVATYGGGTGLATQRECLDILGCSGRDKVYKFAEIVAGVVLAGEVSLGSAISSYDWVSSHEQYGRNR